jgi:hypothetical protein
MKPSCYFVFNPSGTSELKILLDSLLQLTTDWTNSVTPSVIPGISFYIGVTDHTENKSRGLYPLLCDVTAYAEMFLPTCCLETCWITLLFHCCSEWMTRVGPCLQSCCLATRWSTLLQYIVTNVSEKVIIPSSGQKGKMVMDEML